MVKRLWEELSGFLVCFGANISLLVSHSEVGRGLGKGLIDTTVLLTNFIKHTFDALLHVPAVTLQSRRELLGGLVTVISPDAMFSKWHTHPRLFSLAHLCL